MPDKSVRVVLTANTAQYQAGMVSASRTATAFGSAAAASSVRAGGALGAMSVASVKAGGATAAAGKQIAGSAASAGGAMARMSAVGMGMRTAVADPFKAITSPAGLAAIAVITTAKAAITFESAWAGVLKTVEGTPAELSALRDGIRDMARAIPATTTEIAKVAEAAGQLGIQTPNILGFTRTMIDLGETTNLASDEAATALARLANITQMPQTEFDRLGSTVVALGNNLATTEAEIVEMGLRIAGAGKQVGLTEAQILGFAGALSSVGIEAQAGGTAISRVMLDMSKEVEAGGKKLEGFAEVAGMSAGEFRRSFRDDAAGAIVAFVDGLGRMQESGGPVIQTLEDLGLSNIRTRDALLRTAGAGDKLREALDLGTQSWKENTALTDEAEKRYETTASKLAILWNNVTDLAIAIGESFIPAINASLGPLSDFVGFLADAVELYNKLPANITDFSSSTEGARNPIEAMGGAIEDLTTSGGELGEALDALAEAALAAGGAANWAEGRVATFGDGTEVAAQKVRNFAGKTDKALKEWRGSVRSNFDVVGAAFDLIGQKSKLTADKVFRAFEKKIQATVDFKDNMRILARKDLPPEAAAIIAEMGDVGAQVASVLAEEPPKNVRKFGEQLLRAESLSKSLSGSIIRIFEDVASKTPGIGQDAGEGLASGISASKSSVVATASEVGAAAAAAMRAELQTNSPSKVFEKIGLDTMQGFVLGLERGTKDAVAAARAAATGVQKTFKGFGIGGALREGRGKFGDLLGARFGDEGPTRAGIVEFLRSQLDQAQRFAAAMSTLSATGGGLGLGKDLLRQLAEAGPAALPLAEAIAAEGTPFIAQINSLLGDISRASGGQTLSTQTATVNAQTVNLVPMGQIPVQGGDGDSINNLSNFDFRGAQLSFPNVRTGSDADDFLKNLRQVARSGA